MTPRATEQGAEAEQRKVQYDLGKQAGQQEREYEMRRLRETAEKVKEFEKASGINLSAADYGRFHYHDGGKIGAAVLQVLNDGEDVNATLRTIRTFADRLSAEVAAMLGDKVDEPKKRRRAM